MTNDAATAAYLALPDNSPAADVAYARAEARAARDAYRRAASAHDDALDVLRSARAAWRAAAAELDEAYRLTVELDQLEAEAIDAAAA